MTVYDQAMVASSIRVKSALFHFLKTDTHVTIVTKNIVIVLLKIMWLNQKHYKFFGNCFI